MVPRTEEQKERRRLAYPVANERRRARRRAMSLTARRVMDHRNYLGQNGHRFRRALGDPRTPRALLSPAVIDLAWAAGFLEGEGSFMRTAHRLRGGQRVSAGQVQRWPLERLQMCFGGAIGDRPDRSIAVWQITGARARGVMLTLFTFMSPRRREQIRRAMSVVMDPLATEEEASVAGGSVSTGTSEGKATAEGSSGGTP